MHKGKEGDQDRPGRNTVKMVLGPGVWVDMDGNPHFSLPVILEHLGMPNTPENQKLAEQALRERLQRDCPEAKILFRKKPD